MPPSGRLTAIRKRGQAVPPRAAPADAAWDREAQDKTAYAAPPRKDCGAAAHRHQE